MAISILQRLLRLNSAKIHRHHHYFFNPAKIHRHHHYIFFQNPVFYPFIKPPIMGKKMLGITPLVNPYETFLDSCKGLVCLGNPSISREVVLWNPATNFWKTLPPSNTNFGVADMVSMGFGCNAEDDNYSVVRISGFDTRLGAEVYSSKSDCWRTMDVGFNAYVYSPSNYATVNGNPYWTVDLVDSSESGKELGVGLLRFDATEMVFETIALPMIDEEGAQESFVISWRGLLGLLVTMTSENGWLEYIDIWVYEDGERAWRRDARFGMTTMLVETCSNCSTNGSIGGVCKDGEFFIYDSKEGSFIVTDVRKIVPLQFHMFPYDESHALLEGMKSLDVEKEPYSMEMQGFFVLPLPLIFYEELGFC